MCRNSRAEMQKEMLGYAKLQEAFGGGGVPPRGGGRGTKVAEELSRAMEALYGEEYETGVELQRRREKARAELGRIVTTCEVDSTVPMGTRVVIFGSCANKFGSPKSDLDICLQLPPSTSLPDSEDKTGASAMAEIAEKLLDAGMRNVDMVRLTACIPIVMFEYPLAKDESSGTKGGGDSIKANNEQQVLECELSMQFS